VNRRRTKDTYATPKRIGRSKSVGKLPCFSFLGSPFGACSVFEERAICVFGSAPPHGCHSYEIQWLKRKSQSRVAYRSRLLKTATLLQPFTRCDESL